MVFRKMLSKLPASMLGKLMLKGLLKKEVNLSDPIYQKDFNNFTYKVNWNLCGAIGYQIYEQTKYVYKYGELLEDADVNLSFFNIEYIRHLVRGEKIASEMGRDTENNVLLCRKEILVSTHCRNKDVNAQILIAKIPFFRWVIPNFGTSRLSRRLHEEIESTGPVKKEEIILLMKKMLSDSVDIADEIYRKDFQGRVLKVNWDINGITAYQIFEETRYNYEFGKLCEDADLTLIIDNQEYVKRLLRKDPTNFAPGLDPDDNFLIYIKVPVVTMRFKDPNDNAFTLSKLPFFRALNQQVPIDTKEVREQYGSYIPVNQSLGAYENVVVPLKVFEHFINKASNIILRTCPCRERGDCQNHSKEYGCIFMGDGTLDMAIPPDQGYVATKEQALEHTKRAIADGLIPLMGRNIEEAEGQGVKDTGHFLSCCFCCTCCCIVAKTAQFSTSAALSASTNKRIRGLEIKIDPAKCVGCGTCLEICVFKGRAVIDGRAGIDPTSCLGCGRCVVVCPNGAISIEIEDPSYIAEFIAKIESVVDVTDQKTKVSTKAL